MEDPEGSTEAGGISLNGLAQKEAAFVTRVLKVERMNRAELIAARIISGIQPNQTSEQCRKAIISYVHRVITKCFSCQVISFGSFPLKTYLPDGDIDITVRSDNPTLTDSLINRVLNVLENEEKSENAELRVKDIRYIQAEVKIIKCLIENIVVDISFNQLGGLHTLFFLEKVDNLIDGDHLFKRSVLLTKAWCFYESRILGAHHGLISTYALEILVLYIFVVFNKKFSGPLEVLYRFLELFSKFDWEKFCLSLWGPVPISSIPNMPAELPRKDCLELPLTKSFHDVCSSVKDVFPSGQENQEQSFAPKYFNVIDPLRENNNLGRSVSEGNFYRIRSAFTLGADKLAKSLDSPTEDFLTNSFFRNTSAFASTNVLSHNKNQGLEQTSETDDFTEVSCDLGQKRPERLHRTMFSDQNKEEIDDLRNKVPARHHFVGTDMIDTSCEVPRFERQLKISDTGNGCFPFEGSATENMHTYPGILENHNTSFPGEDSFSSSHRSAHNLTDGTMNSKGSDDICAADCQTGKMIVDRHPSADKCQVHQTDKDLVRTLPFSSHRLDGRNQIPVHSTYHHSVSAVKSLHYAKRAVDTVCPRNEFSQFSWSVNRQQSQGYLPLQVSQKFPRRMIPVFPKTSELFSGKSIPPRLSQEDGVRGNSSFNVNPVRCLDHNEGRCQAQESRQHNYSSHVSCSESFTQRNQTTVAENQHPPQGSHCERVQGQRTREKQSIQNSSSLRYIPSSQAAILKSNPSSSRYYTRLPMTNNKFPKYKWQKKSETLKDTSQGSNNDQERGPCSTVGNEPTENLVSNDMAALNIQMHTSSCCESAPVASSPATVQMLADPQSGSGVNRKHEESQSKCHVVSPSVPFSTVRPSSSCQAEEGNRTSFRENFHKGKQVKSEVSHCCQDLKSTEAINQKELSNASKFVKNSTSAILSGDRKSEVLNGDVCSSGKNLQQHDGPPFHPHFLLQVQQMDMKENIPCNIGNSAANMNLNNQSRSFSHYPVSSVDQKYCKSRNDRTSGSYGRRDYYLNCQGNWNQNSKPGIGDRKGSQAHQSTTKMNKMTANNGQVR